LLAALPVAWAISSLYPLAAYQKNTDNLRWIGPWPLHFRLTEGARHALVGIGVWHSLLWRTAAVVVLLAVVEAIIWGSSGQRRSALMMFFVGAVAVALPCVFARDFLVDRNLIAALLPLIIVVAIGLGSPRGGRIALVPVGVLVAVQLIALGGMLNSPREQRADWTAVAAIARRDPQAHVVVLNTNAGFSAALLRYLPEARLLQWDEWVPADELDYVRRADDPHRCDLFYGQACLILPFDNPLPMSFWPSYPLHEHAHTPDFQVERYRADRPLPVQASQLIQNRGSDAAVLFIPARS
jgi:hypothetical protein